MPQIQLPGQGNAQVGGPWGGTMYPSWFENGIGPQLRAKGPEAIANLFADYVTSHPEADYGWYWNNFKPGGQHAANRFGNGQPNNPYGDQPPGDTSGNPPTPPTPGQNPNGTGTDPGGNYTSRPTQPGGEGPGHWQRLISHVNGVRKERWVWQADPAAPTPAPAPAPAPQTDPPEGTGTTATDPPYVGKPKPTGGTTVDGGPSGGGAGGFGNTGGGGMYGGGGGGMGMAGNSVASGGPVSPLPQKPPPKPLPFPNPMPNPQPVPPTDPAQKAVAGAFTGKPGLSTAKKRYAGYYGGSNPNMGQ